MTMGEEPTIKEERRGTQERDQEEREESIGHNLLE